MKPAKFDHFLPTKYGFEWGPLEVVRIASTPTWGYALDIISNRQRLEIRVTPSGIIRVGKPIKNLEKKGTQ
jgi:hypothetical protein